MQYGNGDAAANRHVVAAMEREIAAGREIGLQVAAYRHGKLMVDCWAGLADRDTGRTVDGQTLFNVYSVTKAVVATALNLLVDRGQVEYDAPMARYWPEYAVNGKQDTTVRDALTHRSGVPQMPKGVTPEKMADWDWMVTQIAMETPMAPPGTKAMYQALTFGWLIGEIIRRADPQHRTVGTFVREELGTLLAAPDLWIGLPDSECARVAPMYDARPSSDPETRGELYGIAAPLAVDLTPGVFERPDIRRAEVPGVGGIMTARSEARMWAMLANGGALDGVRLLSPAHVKQLFEPRGNSAEPDLVMYNIPLGISRGGYWLGADRPSVWAAPDPAMICHPGAGNSFGWAEAATGIGGAICHNRLSQPREAQNDPIRNIAQAIREALG